MDKSQSIAINGPINYVKLKSKTSAQTLWIFFDFHCSLVFQTKCEEYEAKDVDKYFNKILDESDKSIDFFFETTPEYIKYSQYNPENKQQSIIQNDIYIKQVRKIFKKHHAVKKNNMIRLHYIDIREYTMIFKLYDLADYLFTSVTTTRLEAINFNRIITTLEDMKNILGPMIIIVDLIDSKHYTFNMEKAKKSKEEMIHELFYKILHQYSNEKNKNIIKQYFYKHFYDAIKDVIKFIDELITHVNEIDTKLYDEYKNQYLVIDEHKYGNTVCAEIYYGVEHDYVDVMTYDLKKEFGKLMQIIANIGSCLMDCYFLRRFLEKSNIIDKAIVYTGAYHSTVYVWFLVKYGDYEMIECNYLSDKTDIDDIQKKLAKMDFPDPALKFLLPNTFTQCIKLKTPI